MKLISCHIENFGKLSDLTVEFSDGINVISQANAWGKSTLAAFLKAMFYGLDGKKDPKAFDKERNIYRPWQGGAYGGEVDFEVNGIRYRISRSFGRTEKNDEFHLYDLATNLESAEYSENIGEELFELDSNSFKRSIYIAQNDCASTTSDGINAKLGNLAENTDDINNFESANKRMKEMLLALTPDRVTGSIKRRKNSITQLEQEIRSFQSAKDGLDAVNVLKKRTQERIEEMQAIRRDYAQALVIASEDSRRKELYAQYETLCQDVAGREEGLNLYKEVFPMGIPDRKQLEEQLKNLRRLEESKASIRDRAFTKDEQILWDKLKEMFASQTPTDEEIDAAIAMLSEVDRQKEEIARQESLLMLYDEDLGKEAVLPDFGKSHLVLQGLGLGCILVGAAGLVAAYLNWIETIRFLSETVFYTATITTFGAGLLLFGIGLVRGIRVKKETESWKQQNDEQTLMQEERFDRLKETITGMKNDVTQVHGTIHSFLGNYHVCCEVKDYASRLYELKTQLHDYQRMSVRQEGLEEEQKRNRSLTDEVMGFVGEYGLTLGQDPIGEFQGLLEKATEYRLALSVYEESVQKKEAFEKRQDKTFWTKEIRCPYSVEELNQMIEEADRSIEELKGSYSQYQKQVDDLQEQLDLQDEKQEELEALKEQQKKDMDSYELIRVTQEFLTKAKEQLTARYMEPISRGFAKYYQMLTRDDRGEWMIDANINLKIREYGELRETKWLSAGYQDLIGVCMRLALVDAMYEDEKPFLILDDPFVNLDEEKVQRGNHLLLSVAEEYQVIYFTCHDSRNPV